MYFIGYFVIFADFKVFSLENKLICLTRSIFVITELKTMKTSILLILFIFTFHTAIAGISPREKQALVDLYHATNGDRWTESWDLTTAAENWKGVTIINNTVVALQLTHNNLTGELPTSIGDLVNLKVLNLHNNTLKGNLPISIGNLRTLKFLNVSLNTFQGNVPEEISKIQSLEHLYIFANDFTGTLAPTISELPFIRNIRMYATHIQTDVKNTLATIQ